MERQDDRPRAHPEGEVSRYEEGAPEEGPAAADAAREYTDADAQPGTEEYGRQATAQRSLEGREQGQEMSAAERASGDPDSGAASVAPGTYDSPAAGTVSGATTRPDSEAGEREAASEAPADRRPAVPPEYQPGEGRADSGASGPKMEAAQGPAPAGSTVPDAPDQTGQTGRGQYSTATETTGAAQATPGDVTLADQPAVLSPDDARTFQTRWESIQGTFIDDPHGATEQADALVGEVMERLSRLREDYLRQLRDAIGDGSDTEGMRVALQRYRAFFQTLLG